jgi:ParB family transcriptional regulator, chromosome partitioning protein
MAKRVPARRRPRKAKPGTKGLEPAECRLEQSEGSAAEAAEAVEKAGGCVVGLYKDPLGHQTLLSESRASVAVLTIRSFGAFRRSL